MERQCSLMRVILSYTSDVVDRAQAIAIFNQMAIDRLDDSEIEKNLVVILSNGVLYGNWPWTSYTVEGSDQ